MSAGQYYRFVYLGKVVGKPRMTQSDKWRTPPRPEVAQYRLFADRLFLTLWGLGYRRDQTIREVRVRAFLSFPRSWPPDEKQRLAGKPHFRKPDTDNIMKAVCDALAVQDQAIWKQDIEKRWDDGGGERLELVIFADPPPN